MAGAALSLLRTREAPKASPSCGCSIRTIEIKKCHCAQETRGGGSLAQTSDLKKAERRAKQRPAEMRPVFSLT